MKTSSSKIYHYEIVIEGGGGDFWFIPMTKSQINFWLKKGEDALAEHLNGGFQDDGVPAALSLGHYAVIGDHAGGLDLDLDGHLAVQGSDGKECLRLTFEVLSPEKWIVVADEVGLRHQAGAFFRTFEKSKWGYKIELTDPFDESKLRLRVTDSPVDELVNGIIYDGLELKRSMEVDKEYAMHKALFLVA